VGNVALERLELHIALSSLPRAHEWVYWTLRSITSPAFNEFVIWVQGEQYDQTPRYINGWEGVGSSLGALADQNPDFRVVFRGNCPSFLCDPWRAYGGARLFFEIYMPAVLSKGFAKFDYVPRIDKPCWEWGLL